MKPVTFSTHYPIAFLAGVVLMTLPLVGVAAGRDRSLEWETRSDWINVRDSLPPAVGDGVVDDTVALQAGLGKLDLVINYTHPQAGPARKR